MKRLLGVLTGVFVPAAFLVSSAGAAVQASTGDTCAASGNGTSYTLVITLPANAPQQGGFAFGASGVTITNINIQGNPGTLSTTSLPANTTAEWTLTSPPRAGESVTAVLTTSAPVTGSFTVLTATSPPSSTFFTPFACAVSGGNVVPSSAFTVDQHITYDSAAGAWHLVVTVPGAGTVSGIQAVATSAGAGSKPVTAARLIESKKVVAMGAGKATLTLKPTSGGSAALKKSGSIKLKLTVAFSPKGGKPASKLLSLTLKK
jgi:hypothetical protein